MLSCTTDYNTEVDSQIIAFLESLLSYCYGHLDYETLFDSLRISEKRYGFHKDSIGFRTKYKLRHNMCSYAFITTCNEEDSVEESWSIFINPDLNHVNTGRKSILADGSIVWDKRSFKNTGRKLVEPEHHYKQTKAIVLVSIVIWAMAHKREKIATHFLREAEKDEILMDIFKGEFLSDILSLPAFISRNCIVPELSGALGNVKIHNQQR